MNERTNEWINDLTNEWTDEWMRAGSPTSSWGSTGAGWETRGHSGKLWRWRWRWRRWWWWQIKIFNYEWTHIISIWHIKIYFFKYLFLVPCFIPVWSWNIINEHIKVMHQNWKRMLLIKEDVLSFPLLTGPNWKSASLNHRRRHRYHHHHHHHPHHHHNHLHHHRRRHHHYHLRHHHSHQNSTIITKHNPSFPGESSHSRCAWSCNKQLDVNSTECNPSTSPESAGMGSLCISSALFPYLTMYDFNHRMGNNTWRGFEMNVCLRYPFICFII